MSQMPPVADSGTSKLVIGFIAGSLFGMFASVGLLNGAATTGQAPVIAQAPSGAVVTGGDLGAGTADGGGTQLADSGGAVQLGEGGGSFLGEGGAVSLGDGSAGQGLTSGETTSGGGFGGGTSSTGGSTSSGTTFSGGTNNNSGSGTSSSGGSTSGGSTSGGTSSGGSTSSGGTSSGSDSGSSGSGTSSGGTSGDDGSSGGTSGGSEEGSTSGSEGTSGSSGGGATVGGGDSGSSSGSTGGSSGGSTGGSGAGSTGGTSGGTSGCASNNGGATDKGVTATEIRVASTVVEDNAGASLLKQAKIGMQAVINEVNAGGGICGRRIVLETRNDGWDAATGLDYIRRFIEAEKFALLVVPSSEGLALAIKNGTISQAKIPVVGTTGLRIDEYSDPWVFPVASATVSYMRTMVKHSYAGGARFYAIVWDNKFRFGVEGRDAYKQYVGELPHASIKSDMPLNPDQQSYPNEAPKFNEECGNDNSGASACDVTALLLVPDVAIKWKNANAGGKKGRGKITYGAQTLFTDDFAATCGGWCDGLVVWTGYNPPIPPTDNTGVKQYASDVRKILPSVDTRNQFVEGAYLGAKVFVAAVQACSPNLTRICIQQTLDKADFGTPLANTLQWRPGSHQSNKFAQAFALEASGGSFNGWQYQNTGWIRDPKL